MQALRALLLMLLLALPATGFAQDVADTPERRAALAKDLGDIEAPNTKRAISDMLSSLERSAPPDQQARFRTYLESVITYDKVRLYSDSINAKEMTADELAALIAFYSSPVGHAVMLKMPLVAQDTGALIQSLVGEALGGTRGRQPPPEQPL